KTFLYDATTFSCTNSNAFVKGRLAEAYTTSSTGSKLTDIAYCYSPRGEIWDAFESTPNSGSTPYHTVASYWANGPLNTLKGVPQHNTWTFGVDGEGRPNSALDGTTTLVTATQNMYNAASQPLVVNLGSGDSDIYTYDPNTGRMATYQYKVGSTPAYVTGTLGWSSNWTLGSLVIADGFEKANAQQCGYTYDDMSRLGSVSCGPTSPNGTTWGQAFSYDPFGNITKTVPHSMTGISWQPGYNTNNQYTLGGANYDGNGNLLADTFNTYAWDSDTNVVGINLNGSTPISITYDALDRAVEESNSGTYKQILYGPTGGKLALMSGQTATNVFLPLPGGEQATYTNSTIRFRHYDWLGSARFESSMAQKEYGDVAYAPFGEPYSILGTPYLSFTGQQQDSISGTYDFLFREYNPVQGRWISPDPSGLSAVDPNNPQSWNRYAYVLNNPLSATDPFGLWCVWEDGTHDSPFRDGGVSRDDCADQGGHWDPTDTIAGIWQDGFGNVTKVNYIDGTTCTTGNCAGGTQTLEELDQWLQGLQSLGTVNVNGGSAPQVDLENSGTVPVATISAGPPDAKKNYCLHQSNMAGVEAVLPGSQILWGTDYSPAAVGELAGHAAAEYGLDAAASSGGFLYSLRSLTGVPMTQAAKWLGRGSIAIWGYQVYQAHKASHRAYKVCMD
ncbi:MAG: RHS repeat-associated core domain-containing protein, partial [Terriglobales bacterium]